MPDPMTPTQHALLRDYAYDTARVGGEETLRAAVRALLAVVAERQRGVPVEVAALLPEWRALAEKATAGPWRLRDCSHGGAVLLRGEPKSRGELHTQIVPEADAAFIAAARTAVPVLCDAVERMAGELSELRNKVAMWAEVAHQREQRLTFLQKTTIASFPKTGLAMVPDGGDEPVVVPVHPLPDILEWAAERDALRAEVARLTRIVDAARVFSAVSLVPDAGNPAVGVPNSEEHAALIAALEERG